MEVAIYDQDASAFSRAQGYAIGLAAELEQDIVKRGRKHVGDSRDNARRFHLTSAWGQAQRNFAFRVGDVFIGMFSRAD